MLTRAKENQPKFKMEKLTNENLIGLGFTHDLSYPSTYYKTFMGCAGVFILTYDIDDETLFVENFATNINHVEELQDLVKLLTL